MITLDTRNLPDNLDSDQRHWVYNGLDVCITAEIRNQLLSKLDDTTRATYDWVLQMQAPILEMMLRGLQVDLTQRDTILFRLEKDLAKLEGQLQRLITEGLGRPVKFNPRSPIQVAKLFNEWLNFPRIRSTDRESLEKLRTQQFYATIFVNHILAIRDKTKAIGFLSTKLDKDNRIRCNFNLAGTKTGRLSSSISDFGTGTNLQNVAPVNRGIFVPEEGRIFVNVDLEQADSRGVGALAWNFFYETEGPEIAGAYLDACESGDLHTTVCRMAWPELEWGDDPKGWRAVANQVAYREYTYRDLAKKLGHGTNYLGKPDTMSIHAKVPAKQITTFQHNYFRAFPCVGMWQNETIHRLRTTGCLHNLLGRRRYFFGRLNDTNVHNEAIAYAPQSTTGDVINKGIYNLWEHGGYHLHVQVHDSILFSVPISRANELIPVALDLLTVHIPLVGGRDFFIPVEAQVGYNWGYATEHNPHGLRKWDGTIPEEPERKHHTLGI